MRNAFDNATDNERNKMVYLKMQFSDQATRSYNFATVEHATRFLLDVDSREFNPVLLSDVSDNMCDWLSDYITSDKNRVLEYICSDLIGRAHADYRTAQWNRIGRCANPIK